MKERQEPTLEQILAQWACLIEMGFYLLTFVPAAILREHVRPAPRAPDERDPR